MATEHFCLRWNNHQSTLVSVFDNLLESGTLVDCTLAADGRYLKAHKVVLSACSPYLGMLLSQHYDKHPIIILKDVKFDELKAMLDYMYRGEVNISQEQLSTFLKAAETLQIKGLTDAGSDEGNGLHPNRPPSSNSTTSANEDPQSPGPPGEGGSSPGPRKRKRNKHGDDGEGDSASKISLSEGSDRLSGTSVGSPSAKSASVKREPGDGEGDGQMSVDDSGEVVMMSRPGPSNGGTNNKAPWILSADSSGEEMQLTPGQDGHPRLLNVQDKVNEREESSGKSSEVKEEEIKKEFQQETDPFGEERNAWDEVNRPNVEDCEMFYSVVRSEDELIIPDPLEEPTIVSGLTPRYYELPAESIFPTVHQDKSEQCCGDHHSLNHKYNNDCQLLQKVLPSLDQSTRDSIAKGKILISVRRVENKVSVKTVPKSCPSVSKPHLSSMTIQNTLPAQNCVRSSSQSIPPSPNCSKPAEVADAFNKNNVKAKKTKLDIISKYRTILPAPVGNSSGSSKSSNNENQFPTSSSLQCSTSPSSTSAGNATENVSVQPNNSLQNQTGMTNESSLTPLPHSVTQNVQVGNPSPSLLSIPQQVQGGQFINNPCNMLSLPQQSQASQMNNTNTSTAVLSIAPQFSVPIQAGNFQMQFTSNAGDFQNAQFFTNTSMSGNQLMSNQNVLTQQSVTHPVFVTSDMFGGSQSTAQTNFSPTPSPIYVRTPSEYVQANPTTNDPLAQPVRGRGTFTRGRGGRPSTRGRPAFRTRGILPAPQQPVILPKPKQILPNLRPTAPSIYLRTQGGFVQADSSAGKK